MATEDGHGGPVQGLAHGRATIPNAAPARRCPRSRFRGARQTSAAPGRPRHPGSGCSAMSTATTTRSTPGTVHNNAVRFAQPRWFCRRSRVPDSIGQVVDLGAGQSGPTPYQVAEDPDAVPALFRNPPRDGRARRVEVLVRLRGRNAAAARSRERRRLAQQPP